MASLLDADINSCKIDLKYKDERVEGWTRQYLAQPTMFKTSEIYTTAKSGGKACPNG
jgi:hypothetical protein